MSHDSKVSADWHNTPVLTPRSSPSSGQSIFSRPKPIDLTLPHRFGPGGGYTLDIDLEDDEEDVRSLSGARNNVVFDAEGQQRQKQQRRPVAPVRPVDIGDDTDTWASLG